MAARHHPTRQWKGYLLIVTAAAMWGTNGVAAKHLFNQGITPSMLVQIRSALSFAMLFGILAFFKRDLIRVSKKDLPFLASFAIAGMGMVNLMYFYTVSKTNVVTAILLQYTGIVFIAIFAVSFQGERLTWVKVASLASALAGCFLMVGGYDLNQLSLNAVGLACGLTAALFYAFYILYGEWGLKRFSPWTMVVYAFGFTALFWALFITPWQISARSFSLSWWPHLLYVVILGTVVPFGLFFEGLKYIRATRASITSTLEPIVAGVVSYFLLSETLFPVQIIGGFSVIVAIILLQIEKE